MAGDHRSLKNLDAFQAAHNSINEKWAKSVRDSMISEMSRLGVGNTGNLASALKTKMKMEFGEVYAIAFKFPRYGIMVQKGVGRGYPIESVMGNGSALARKAKPWFSSPLDNESGLKALADKLADLNGDVAVNMATLEGLRN